MHLQLLFINKWLFTQKTVIYASNLCSKKPPEKLFIKSNEIKTFFFKKEKLFL